LIYDATIVLSQLYTLYYHNCIHNWLAHINLTPSIAQRGQAVNFELQLYCWHWRITWDWHIQIQNL